MIFMLEKCSIVHKNIEAFSVKLRHKISTIVHTNIHIHDIAMHYLK